MKRFYDRHEKACTWEGQVTFKIKKKLDSSKYNGRFCKVVPVSDSEFNVFEGGRTYAVNLGVNRITCPYGVWNISGILCKHTTTCISKKKGDIQQYFDNYYSKETFMQADIDYIHLMLDITMAEFIK